MNDDKTKRTPVLGPLLLVLKSRRVIIALSALAVGLLLMAVPELEAVRAELLTLVIALALAVIGGYSVEDAAISARKTLRRGQPEPDADDERLREAVRQVLAERDDAQDG